MVTPTFTDLFDFVPDVGDWRLRMTMRNAHREANFLRLVTGRGWILETGDTESHSVSGSVLLVGVALWSRPDMEFLDWVPEVGRACIIAVFNSDLLGDSERRKAVIPNVGLPTQTPVVALYRKGQLIESAEGYAASQALVLAQCKAV
jgi:hypothetical protein